MYKLINTNTNRVLKAKVDINDKEATLLNYAYALNDSPKRYQKVYTAQDEFELNLFVYRQPI